MKPHPAPATRLRSLHDQHGAPLVDFDWYPTLDLLYVYWHGHLTAASVVQGVQSALELPQFATRPLPRRALTNHQQVSGTWTEALPWLQYDWLPQAHARGLRLLAHVASQDPACRLSLQHELPEFNDALRQLLSGVRSFRHEPPAWYWLTHR